MKNRSINMVLWRRIARTLVLCLVVAACIKISLNPSVLKMASAVDFRNNSYGNPGDNTVRTFNLNGLFHTTGNGQGTSLQMITVISKPTGSPLADTGTKSVFSRFKARTTHIKKQNKTMIKLPSINETNLTSNSTKTGSFSRHPNKFDLELISSGKFKPENLMKAGPFKFLSNYRSPCWKIARTEEKELRIHCLPYFYLIGAPKSGTTDLHRRLVQHPEISKLVVKEPHWLTRKHYYYHGKTGGYSNLTDYLKFFTFATRDIYMKEDSSGYHSTIFGDCSASTMWDNDYWTILPEYRNLTEPLYTNADYIYHLNPNTKIIAILRNPVERLYSDYLFFQHGSPKVFHEGVVNMIKYTNACLRNNTLRHCLYTPQKSLYSKEVRLRIGIYHLHLKEYLRVFPRDQVMVIKLEDFSNKTSTYMQKIFSFLEISKLDEKDLQKIADPEKHANMRREKDQIAGEMLPQTRKMLKEFYRPHNKLLTELLGESFNYNSDLG